GTIRQKWGKLTDNDLALIDGKREQLEGVIQERYGLAKDQARNDVDAWLKSLP
ncbi:MAG: CsbD family protein, partial [Xanthobacteraceae bacterium]